MKGNVILSEAKRRTCGLDAWMLSFFRRNPCIACRELLGINLLDSQKYILQESWNKPHVLWCCCRNFGKSFLGAILMLLKAMLFENQAIYIVSSVGDQSKQTFTVIEQIVTRIGKTAASIKALKDIAENETVKSPSNKTGFSHNPSGYHVQFYNGSQIFTLNSNPDNNRSRRATMIFFDECAFCSSELISVCEAFGAQSSEFTSSTDASFDIGTQTRKCPTQLVYASSMSEMDRIFYRHYKYFALRMFSGDRDYFVCDMICDTAIQTYMDGKPYLPLLTQAKVDAAMAADRDKALREYYNKPIQDGGEDQIIKWGQIRRNEAFALPEVTAAPGGRYAIAFDPARIRDNSILTILKICQDKKVGYYGEVVGCLNMLDFSSRKRYKLDSNRQLDIIRETILAYNGAAPDYANIGAILFDAGAGGGGISSYADPLLMEWTDKSGTKHKGLLDNTDPLYEGYQELYPDNSHILRLINPRRSKREMVEQLVELIGLDLIKFPYEYSRQGYLSLIQTDPKTGEETIVEHTLSFEEECALVNIDALKRELTIYRYKNGENTTVTYTLPRDKERSMNDDRFYTLIMLAHYLYELRRSDYREQGTKDYGHMIFVN